MRVDAVDARCVGWRRCRGVSGLLSSGLIEDACRGRQLCRGVGGVPRGGGSVAMLRSSLIEMRVVRIGNDLGTLLNINLHRGFAACASVHREGGVPSTQSVPVGLIRRTDNCSGCHPSSNLMRHSPHP
jgi:hypothetical protein